MRILRIVFWALLVTIGAIIGDRFGVPDQLRALPDTILGAAKGAIGGSPAATSGTTSTASTSGSAPSSAAPSGEKIDCGPASYYADSLAGNPTASGEPYNPSSYTAAHKTLPFGTKLRVVREDTGASVDVTVNDRGPFTPGRIIDLSRVAAERIDLTTAGVTDVCIYAK